MRKEMRNVRVSLNYVLPVPFLPHCKNGYIRLINVSYFDLWDYDKVIQGRG